MKKFKTEMHCHIRDASRYSPVSAEELVYEYLKHNYSTIVLTNTFSHPYSGNQAGSHDLSDIIEYEYRAYDILRNAANGALNILFGLEISFNEFDDNDYLLYGLTKEFLLSCKDIFNMGIKEFYNHAKECGCLVIQAHPFREFTAVVPYDYVDGYEVFNGHPGHNSRNPMSKAWAEYQGVKIVTSGTDYREISHTPRAGILTDVEITSMDQLVDILKSRKYELIEVN